MKPEPRGIRNRNPGNIRARASVHWDGECRSDDRGFCTFVTAHFGIRAMSRVLREYADRDGIVTIGGMIARWDGANVAGRETYAGYVANWLRITTDLRIDITASLGEIVPAIITFENGTQPYAQELILPAIRASKPQ